MKKQIWKKLTADEKQSLAQELDVSVDFLRQVFVHNRQTTPARARFLAEYSGIGAHEFCSAFLPGDVLMFSQV